jgi:hypothetical protein
MTGRQKGNVLGAWGACAREHRPAAEGPKAGFFVGFCLFEFLKANFLEWGASRESPTGVLGGGCAVASEAPPSPPSQQQQPPPSPRLFTATPFSGGASLPWCVI